jgi:hypothetical protein
MITLYFRCKLLTDIVLNQGAATEGNQKSLDFIPGSNFLGIVAKELYTGLNPEESLELFHSGKVRFGDAHPEKDGKRALRIPASMYGAKSDENMTKGLYIHHEVNDPNEKKYKDFQPKQCRSGFYLFENEYIEKLKVEKTFAIKSAYDRNSRRSADEKMYGYESLESGSAWIFEVTLDNDAWADKIKETLKGKKRIGRSRTAQYGLVEIENINDYKVTVESKTDNNEFALVYADTRLIFLDEYGIPTFQPTAEDLGFENGEIEWSKTQIRTFQYAPWNFKRQVRDTDRCGIEKGSVIYVKKNKGADKLIYPEKTFVGVYQNEGFGKVIFNPDLLKAKPDSNGKALYEVKTSQTHEEKPSPITSTDPLFVYLDKQQKQAKVEREILKSINEFVKTNKDDFTKENFASQWGTIRSIATQYPDKNKIILELLDKKERDPKGKEIPTAYLTHGVAKDKWDERGRRNKFKKFIEEKLNGLSDKDFQSAIINLASEMAKISKK